MSNLIRQVGQRPQRASSGRLSIPEPPVYARRFDGVDDEIQCSIGSCNIAFGTIACLVRRTQASAAEQWIGNWTSGNALTTAKVGQEPGSDGNNPRGWNNAHATFDLVPNNDWAIVVFTKGSGNVIPRSHGFVGGSWTHGDADFSSGDAVSQTGGTVRFATIVNGLFWTQFDIAVAGEWSVVLSDAQVEELSTNRATQDWMNNSGGAPVGLWDFNQASTATAVTDLTGNGANQTSITGTEVITTGPPDWTYGVAAPVDVPLGLTTETDTAQSFSVAFNVPLGLTTETDTAQPLTVNPRVNLGLATEADTAQSFAVTKTVNLGLPTEIDAALSVATVTQVRLGLPTETDAALPLTLTKNVAVGLATETDEALPITVDIPGAGGTARDRLLIHVGT